MLHAYFSADQNGEILADIGGSYSRGSIIGDYFHLYNVKSTDGNTYNLEGKFYEDEINGESTRISNDGFDLNYNEFMIMYAEKSDQAVEGVSTDNFLVANHELPATMTMTALIQNVETEVFESKAHYISFGKERTITYAENDEVAFGVFDEYGMVNIVVNNAQDGTLLRYLYGSLDYNNGWELSLSEYDK